MNRAAIWAIMLQAVVSPGASQEADTASVWWTPYDHLPPGVFILPVDSLYEFEADDPREISDNLRAFGPVTKKGRFHGQHSSTWAYDFEWIRPQPQTCKPVDLRIIARSVVMLPHLSNFESVDPGLRWDWARYLAALQEHELGHRQILTDYLTALRLRLIDEPPRLCEMYPGAFEPILSGGRQDLRVLQEAYDEETDHGRTQGAVWPPTPGT